MEKNGKKSKTLLGLTIDSIYAIRYNVNGFTRQPEQDMGNVFVLGDLLTM